jgi:phosphatidate cytidylyltransferase
MTSSPSAKAFDWSNLGLRVISATILIPVVVLAIWTGSWLFLLMTAVAVALLSNEWGQLCAKRAPARISILIAAAVLAPTFFAHWGFFTAAAIALTVGSALVALCARVLKEHPWDCAYGVFYIGIPVLAITWLRTTPEGLTWTIALFAVTWSADIVAYAVGNVVKGPKLWPRFSPNKTWSGFIGGLIGAILAAVTVAVLSELKISIGAAAVVGLLGGLATMAGDLWESILKRRYGVKDSGDLIPGHGGMLDRVDGLMFAAVIVAGARLIAFIGFPF